MTINEFFEKTYYERHRPIIFCNDGFNMSVQAGYLFYSTPRENIKTGYTTAEIGFPSEHEPLIQHYSESSFDYCNTVYPFVPCELIDKVIEKHGGIDEEATFDW